MTCPHNGNYRYLYELEDDRSVDDVPNTPEEIASGFSTSNAYYIGNTALNALNFLRVEICAGVKSGDGTCNMDCHELRVVDIGGQITDASWTATKIPSDTSIPSNFKKMIACFTGQCAGDSYGGNSGDASSNKWFWHCNGDDVCSTKLWGMTPAGTAWGNNAKTASSIGGHTDHGGKVAWHVWGSGVTMRLTADCEMGAWSSCASGPSVFQIRYK